MAKLHITEDCIGCESCVELCPEVFAMDPVSGHAEVNDPDSTLPCVDEAMDACPTEAIVRQ